MNFGPQTSEADSFAIMDRALELGINFFDTANVYGWKTGEGVTEQIIGRWFAQGGGRREKVVLATKVYGEMGDWPNERGCRRCTSAARARTACAACRPTTSTCTRCTTSTATRRGTRSGRRWSMLVAQGKVLYVGSSNFAGWHIAQANEAATARHFLGLVSEQSLYNLNARTVELEVIPACRGLRHGHDPVEPARRRAARRRARRRPSEGRRARRGARSRTIEEHRATARGVGEALRASSASSRPTSRWPGCSPTPSSPRRSSARARSSSSTASLRALEMTLDEATMTKLDEIFPGPGGAAPEAYAW